jgi:hypothetical protein
MVQSALVVPTHSTGTTLIVLVDTQPKAEVNVNVGVPVVTAVTAPGVDVVAKAVYEITHGLDAAAVTEVV